MRVAGGRYAPGVSGNPKGSKPIDPEVRSLARLHAPEAIDTLVQLLRHSRSEVTRKAAADSILDRAYGKPNQSLSGPDGGAIPFETGALLMAKLSAIAAEMEKEDKARGIRMEKPAEADVADGGKNESATDRPGRGPGD